MKAVFMNEPGGPEVLELRDAPTPTISHDTEILVRLKAAGINPVDTKLRSRGTFYPDRMPAILGCDGAGIVESVGSAVQRYQPGDSVYFCHGGIGAHPGNYAEYAVVDERFAAPKPRDLDFAQAAAAPLVALTAWESLFERAGLQSGQRVLIHAGAGGVGHIAVQLAAWVGARVATTVGSADKARLVEELGAHRPILYKEEEFVEAVKAWTDGQGADVALDMVGGETLVRTFETLKVFGHLVTILQPPSEADWKEARLRNLCITLELMLTPMLLSDPDLLHRQAGILERCAELFDTGKLRIHVDHALPLSEAAQAHRLIEEGHMTGKVVLLTE